MVPAKDFTIVPCRQPRDSVLQTFGHRWDLTTFQAALVDHHHVVPLRILDLANSMRVEDLTFDINNYK